MTERNFPACARRARDARFLPAALAACALACALYGGRARAQQAGAAAPRDASSVVGIWHATSAGLRVATLTIVPEGEGLAGAFVGYDYDRKLEIGQPVEGPPPKVSMRTGSLLSDLKLDGDTLSFKIHLRPPGAPQAFEVTGTANFDGAGAGELRLSAPRKPEPLVLKLTRE